MKADVVVIGGGAAGLMCAALAAKRGKRVIVLERTAKVGKKILMSGGGRCNFTNLYTEPENFISNNPHFCKSALSRYTQWDFIGLVSDYEIPYHEKTLGQLFCDNSAKDILTMLLSECDKHNVTIHTHSDIREIEFNEHYSIHTQKAVIEAETVVMATGGLSIPSMGVTGFGYDVARQFGMTVLPIRAGLVPFTFTDNLKLLTNTLSGLSVDVMASNSLASFRENLLFTHRGLSGPAILQISSYWHQGETVDVNLLPETNTTDWLLGAKKAQPKSLLKSVISDRLPKKLVAELEALWWADVDRKPLGEISDTVLASVASKLAGWSLKPAGTEGYRTAEVTLGGVDTDQISSKTMESTLQPGLFFIGEVVDVTGHLGGFNFQWAWSSAFAAAEAV